MSMFMFTIAVAIFSMLVGVTLINRDEINDANIMSIDEAFEVC